MQVFALVQRSLRLSCNSLFWLLVDAGCGYSSLDDRFLANSLGLLWFSLRDRLVEILASTNRLSYEGLSWLSLTANLVHIGEAIVLFAFLQVAFAGTPGAVAGAQGMLGDTMFWAGAVGLGIVVPVILGNLKGGASLKLVSGVCAIIGALCLRASVLFAGVFDPVIF